MSFLSTIQKPRINSQITALELRVIGAGGENLGVMSRDAALALARPEEGLDLIEIAPGAKPPVARVMSYDKWRYEEEKKEKKERFAQRKKSAGLKQIQISARAAANDLQIKLHKLEEFLAEGHLVEIQLRLRGREKGNKDWARHKLDKFLKMITVEYRVLSQPKFGGRGMLMQIGKR